MNIPIYQLPYLRRHEDRARAARQAAATPSADTIRMAHTAADALTLRGIPAVGRSVAGHIAGTQPEHAACR